MASKLLKGLVVLNTRPAHQQQALNDAIAASGGETVSLPLLRIVPLDDPDHRQRLVSLVQQLPRCDILVFVSANAVNHAAPLIRESHPELPASLKLFAIGPSTAAAVQQYFEQPVQQAATGTTSEDLLALPDLQELDNKNVMIVRGQGGRETLRQTLETRGATVQYLEVYRRQHEPVSTRHFNACIDGGKVNAIVVTSAESLQRILELAADNKGRLTLLPLIVPSTRIAAIAKTAGFTNVIEAAGAGEAAIVAALLTIADNFG